MGKTFVVFVVSNATTKVSPINKVLSIGCEGFNTNIYLEGHHKSFAQQNLLLTEFPLNKLEQFLD